jgi:flagellar motility protein MotE (MotC chaperone)
MTPTQQLYRLESPSQVEVGDTVYEVIRFGTEDHHVKFKAHKVLKVERAACKLAHADHGQPVKMAFHALMAERPKLSLDKVRERPAVALVQPRAQPEDDAFSAWLDMGRGLIDELDVQREKLCDERERWNDEAEGIVAVHARRVAELEAQLRDARREMEAERARRKDAVRGLDEQIAALEARRTALSRVLKQTGDQP